MQYYKNRNTGGLIKAERHDSGTSPGYYVYYASGQEGIWYSEELFNATYEPHDSILATLSSNLIKYMAK